MTASETKDVADKDKTIKAVKGPSSLLSTCNLAVGYGGSHAIVSGVDISVPAGEVLVIVGPNGVGKSTLLHTIARELAPMGGVVWLGSDDLAKLDQHRIAQRMATMSTSQHATELFTCLDAVELGRYPYTGRFGNLSETDRIKVRECMELTRTWELRNQDLTQLSDGQRQRVMLARALVQEPQILLLDEPTAFLDIRYQIELLSLIRTLAHQRRFAVISSLHELDLTQKFADRVLCLKDGHVLAYGSPEQTLTRDRVSQLFDLGTSAGENGAFDPLLGSIEMPRPTGDPRVFVIAGGCSGTQAFRQLQRADIPFATGILHEGEVDWAVARNIATAMVIERTFEPISDMAVERAKVLLASCDVVLDCIGDDGNGAESVPIKTPAHKLKDYARTREIPVVFGVNDALAILTRS